MSLSEKIADAKFSKGVAGYTVKEVDGFIADILPLVKEQEQIITALRAKLGAFEDKQADIAKQEHDAYRLLDAAKKEAEAIVTAANVNAKKINDEARISAEAENRVAAARARELLEKAEKEARSCIDTATGNAERIIAVADAKGKAMLSAAKAEHMQILNRAKLLSGECESFEARFRTLVAETAMSLSRLNEGSTLPKAPKPEAELAITPRHEPEHMAAPEKEPEPIIEELVPERPHEPEKVTDVGFAGGKPVNSRADSAERSHRRLYDTVSVTYESDDDFEDIKKIMREGKMRKDPTDFAE